MLLAEVLSAASVVPFVVVGWRLRQSGRTAGQQYGRLTGRVCALLIGLGAFAFAFVNATALGAAIRESIGLAVYAATFILSLAVAPMMISSRLSHKRNPNHLPW